MLEKIEISRFKSFKNVKLKLGKLNILIGANATGKSNFFDAIRLLEGLSEDLTIDEIFNGKQRTSTSLVWDGIRGGSEGALYRPRNVRTYKTKKAIESNDFEIRTSWKVDEKILDFDCTINPSKGIIVNESLASDTGGKVYSTKLKKGGIPHHVNVYNREVGAPPVFEFDRSKSVLNQLLVTNIGLGDDALGDIVDIFIALSDTQKLDLNPSILRLPTRNAKAGRLGEHGENFPAVIANIIKNPSKKEALSKWLNLLTPSDIESIKPLKTKIGDIYFGITEGKKTVYAPSLSDGTLRFSALLAAFFQPHEPQMLLLEEVENGIHPTRLKLLAELIQARAEKTSTQFFITTHSPLFLAWLDKSFYEHVFFCFRKQDGSSGIKSLTEIPHLMETIKRFPVSDLFAEGWLESAVLSNEA